MHQKEFVEFILALRINGEISKTYIKGKKKNVKIKFSGKKPKQYNSNEKNDA